MMWYYVMIGVFTPLVFIAGVAFRHFLGEPKRGKWETECWEGERPYFSCSECKNKEIFKYKYCPYCGTRMDGDNSNG